MPEPNSPIPPAPSTRSNSRKPIIILSIIAVLLCLVSIITVAAILLLNRQAPVKEVASSQRVRGDAREYYPYGEVEEEKNVAGWIGPEGGVLLAELANNVRAYLVVPPGSTSLEGENYQLTPYFSMPTSKNAPALPTELGYGVDFEIIDSGYDTFEPIYLVFDLDQGKTVSEIAKDEKLNYFCLPTLATFNPSGCALLKNIPLSEHTNTKYGVVSPIRDPEYNDLMFFNSTIPIGYDNLIVTQITNQATFIPIVLSKDVLTDVVRADKPGFTIPLIEGMVHAVNNNIFYDDIETYYHLNKAFSALGDPVDTNKALQILIKYEGYLKALKGQANKIAKDKITYDTAISYIDLQLGDYPLLKNELKIALIEGMQSRGKISSSQAYQTLLGILELRRLEKSDFPDAKYVRYEMLNDILADIDYFIDPEANAGINNKLMFESAIWGMPEYFPGVRVAEDTQSSLPWLLQASAAGNSTLPPDAPQAWRDFMEKLEGELNEMLKNPCAYSGLDILKGAQLAQMIGREDLADRLLQVLKDQLIADLRLGRGNLNDWSLAQMFGLDHDYSCVDDLYRDQVLRQSTRLTCTTLMEKNLKNFAWNEIKCDEVLLPNDPPKIPEDCELPDPPRCNR